ncbi:MAG: hypothetical protein M3007_05970, partial [Candidatus Eremiobacteraeota bacterium]|nr:hypothetical protein [Candidatus Eremiobacteraeota bacterium]
MTRPTVLKLATTAAVLVGAFFAGSTLHVPAIAADRYSDLVNAVNSCNSSSACLVEQNIGGGPGLEGVSAHGYGSYGITNLNSTRTASAAGVLGYDAATTEFGGNLNAGVQGRSNNGNGVFGLTKHKSMSGAPAAGVYGFDESRDGAPFNYGVWGESLDGTGVFAESFGYVGVEAIGGGDSANLAFPALSIVNGDPAPSHLVDACSALVDVPCDHAAPSR